MNDRLMAGGNGNGHPAGCNRTDLQEFPAQVLEKILSLGGLASGLTHELRCVPPLAGSMNLGAKPVQQWRIVAAR